MSYYALTGFGADVPVTEDATLPETETPPEQKSPSDAASIAIILMVGIPLVAIVGAAIYFKYKVTSQIIEKEGAGKALMFEGGTAAIGVLSERLSRR